jgi:hypothetical protein
MCQRPGPLNVSLYVALKSECVGALGESFSPCAQELFQYGPALIGADAPDVDKDDRVEYLQHAEILVVLVGEEEIHLFTEKHLHDAIIDVVTKEAFVHPMLEIGNHGLGVAVLAFVKESHNAGIFTYVAVEIHIGDAQVGDLEKINVQDDFKHVVRCTSDMEEISGTGLKKLGQASKYQGLLVLENLVECTFRNAQVGGDAIDFDFPDAMPHERFHGSDQDSLSKFRMDVVHLFHVFHTV